MERQSESQESFDVDGMLGKLAKWLRILGFDTKYPCRVPSQGRVFVTARRRTKYSGAVIVGSANCFSQLKQALDEVGAKPAPELFLSRCLMCNVRVHEVPSEMVKDQAPPEVFAMTHSFKRCPKCGRVYWDGSHGERMKRKLQDSGISLV
jgi:uncharacterized protein